MMCLTNMIKHIVAGRYWQKVADERKKRPYAITLADKNAPNEEVWRQVRKSRSYCYILLY